MSRRILLRAAKDPFHAPVVEEMVQRDLVASNTGNLLFSDSAYRMLSTSDVEVVTNGPRLNGDPSQADRINEEYDAFVVPLANAFRPDFLPALRRLTGLIEKLTIPVTVLGVGAQTDLDYSLEEMAPLDDAVRRFLTVVLDRSPSVGVRGELTEAYVRSLGFSDVEVIGCPSMFLHGADLQVRPVGELGPDSRLAVSISNWVDGIGDLVMQNYARYPGLTYFAQETRDLRLMYWRDVAEAAAATNDVPDVLTHPLFAEGRTVFHLGTAPWIEDLRGYDAAFGTRIHGNVAALLAGTPGFVLCHDSRTLELSRYFEIPHARVTDVAPGTDVADLLRDADYGPLVAGHAERLDRMTGYLAKHGFDTVFSPGQDGGAAFDERVAAITHPGPAEVWDGTADDGLGYRVAWLKDADTRTKERLAEQNRKVAQLTKTVRTLEKSAARADALEKELERLRTRTASLEKSVKQVKAVQSVPLATRVRRGVSTRARRVLRLDRG